MRLFLLYCLLGLGIVAGNDKYGNIPVVFDDSDGEVLISLSGDPMPLIFRNSIFDDAYIKFVRLAVVDNTNTKVFRLFRVGNDSYITPKTLCVISMPVYSSTVFDCKTPVVNVNFRPILSETGTNRQEKCEYDGKPFHAANIEKI